MKTLESLAVTSDVAAVLPRVILDAVETTAQAARFGRALCRINRDIVGAKGRSIYVPVRKTMTAATVAENTAPADAVPASFVTAIEVSVKKIGLLAQLSQEMIDGAQVDVINNALEEAGLGIAEREDREILVAFGNIQGTGSNSTLSTSRRKSITGAIGATAYDELVTARAVLLANNYKPDIALVSPGVEISLLKDSRFIDASAYGDREPILNGEVGKAAGMKIVVSNNAVETGLVFGTAGANNTTVDDAMFVVDSMHAAYFVIKRDIELKRWDRQDKDNTELYFFEEFGAAVTNEKAMYITYWV